MVPAIGVGRNGLNTIFSTSSMSSLDLNVSAIRRPFSNTSRSFSFSGAIRSGLPSSVSSHTQWHLVPNRQLASRLASHSAFSSSGVLPSFAALRLSISPDGSNSGKNLCIKVVPETYYTSRPPTTEEYRWSSSVNVIDTPEGCTALEQAGIKRPLSLPYQAAVGRVDIRMPVLADDRHHYVFAGFHYLRVYYVGLQYESANDFLFEISEIAGFT